MVDTLDVTRNLDVSLDCACPTEKVYCQSTIITSIVLIHNCIDFITLQSTFNINQLIHINQA